VEDTVKWESVAEKITCDKSAPVDCPGAYGFTVTKKGKYKIGPGPHDEVKEGQISETELGILNDAAKMVLDGDPVSSQEECYHREGQKGASDTVTENLSDGSSADVYWEQGAQKIVCYRGGQQGATLLHDDIKVIMKKYYPRRFP
jgi:hypothetical protein